MRKFRIDTTAVRQGRTVESNCNSIAFYNKGSVNVTINTVELAPGESIAFGGHCGEVDLTFYEISFPSTTGALVYVIRKIDAK